MKILEMTTIAASARNFCAPLGRELLRRGHSVELAFQPHGSVTALEEEFPVHNIRLSRRPFSVRNVRGLKDIHGLLRRIKPDVLHVHTPVAGFIGRLAGLSQGIPLVWSYRGDPTQSMPRPIRKLFWRAEDFVNKRSNAIITLTHLQRRELEGRLGRNRPPIIVQGCGACGVDLDRFNVATSKGNGANTRKLLRIPKEAIVIGFVGRLVSHKGLIELCQVFHRLRQKNEHVFLLIVGGHAHEERNAVKRNRFQIALQQSEERVIFTGSVRDVENYIAAMDVLAVPSYEEGFGQVYAEAAALGKPSIGCFGTGAEEAIGHRKTGILVKPRDVHSLYEALTELVRDGSLRNELGERALRRARDVFDSNRVIRLQADVIERVGRRQDLSDIASQ